MTRTRAWVARGLFGAAMAFAMAVPVQAADEKNAEAEAPTGPPSATLELASEEMRLIMGGTAGKGTLHYKGTNHAFTFKSASAGIGAKAVKSVSAKGEVFGLQSLGDFAGKYTSITKTALAGSSQVAATYKNDKGVVVKLVGTVEGVGLGLGGGMATIELVDD